MVLQKFYDGLVKHIDFREGDSLESPFFFQGSVLELDMQQLIYRGGFFGTYIEDYKELVFEVNNNYIPQNKNDIGGISVVKGRLKADFYEYINEEAEYDLKYIRVFKQHNTYYGEGSPDGILWLNRNSVVIPNAELFSITLQGQTSFPINELKLYERPWFSIYNTIHRHRIEFETTDGIIINHTVNELDESADLIAPLYPLSGIIRFYNENNEIVLEQEMIEVWGGDKYCFGINVELQTLEGESLLLETNKFIGSARKNEPLIIQVKAVNLDNIGISDVFVTVDESSEIYDLVNLSIDNTTYTKEISFSLDGNQEQPFFIKIEFPIDYIPSSYDGDRQLFYLNLH